MIDRGKYILLLVLGILIILSPTVFGATCPELAESGGVTSGFLVPNIFLCPYSPDEPGVSETCPTGQQITKFTYDRPTMPAYYHQSLGLFVRADQVQFAAEENYTGANAVKSSLKVEGLCYEGIEGQYYIWYQVDPGGMAYISPSDGYCYEKAHVVNWDHSSGDYCKEECVGHQVDYFATSSSCCGDDEITDCARAVGGAKTVCSQIGETWNWKRSLETKGDIFEFSCANISIVSDGSNFFKCTDESIGAGLSDLGFKYITAPDKRHMYACFDDPSSGKKRIAECSGSARISSSGIAKDTGDSILVGEDTYFCVLDRAAEDDLASWTDNLDGIGDANKNDCNNAKTPSGTSAGYKWTGSKCCAEPDDGDEFYSDGEGYTDSNPYGGGCWNKSVVLHGSSPPGSRILFDLINYRGVFEGCSIQGDDPVLGIEDTHTGEAVVNNNDYCTLLADARGSGQHLFCSFNGNWVGTTEIGKNFLKSTEWDTSKGCCNEDQCWDSNTDMCIDDQSESSLPITYHGYRCMEGEWDNTSVVKYTWDGAESGFCANVDQCLASPSPLSPVNCVDTGEYDLNKYCENGEWTSRARLLALALLQYGSSKSPNEYTLFCDTYDNILNFYNYEVGGQPVLNYLQGETFCQGKPCTNEFCVLKYSGGVAFGTSVNEPINSERSFLTALEKPASLCDAAMIDDNQYHVCGSSNIWYNHGHGTIIQLSTSDSLGAVSWAEAFTAFIKNPFNTIKNWIAPKVEELSFLNQTRMFTKIYVDVHGSKKVFAFLEEGQTVRVDGFTMEDVDYLGLEYSNLGVTPCGLIRNYDSSVSCTSDQTIFAQSRAGSQSNLVDAWPDLTAKLRIR